MKHGACLWRCAVIFFFATSSQAFMIQMPCQRKDVFHKLAHECRPRLLTSPALFMSGGLSGHGTGTRTQKTPTRELPLASKVSKEARIFAALAAGVILCASPEASKAEQEFAPPVLDQARTLTSRASARLSENLEGFEEDTGFRILVLSEDPQVVNKSPKQLKAMWGLPDPDAIVVLIRPGSGNILAFNYGEKIAKILPDRFFGELTGRLGNQYNVRDVGADGVVQETVGILEKCLRKGGCFFVPGIGKDQYTATLVSSVAGGVFCGFSLLTGAQFISKDAKGEDAIFKWAPLLFFPLWGLFFIGLGLNPLLQREADAQLIIQNVVAFGAAAAATGLIYPKLLGVWSGYL